MKSENNYSNLEIIKKNILYDALAYNISQQQANSVRKKQAREQQKQDYQMINRRVSTELNDEQEKQRSKKEYIRSLLTSQYERQIEDKRYHQLDEVRQNRSYAHLEEDYQKAYEEKRARDLAKLYKAQKTINPINPEMDKGLNQATQNLRSRVTTQSDIHSHESYADYLKRQIERKRQQKEIQKRNKSIQERIWVQRNEEALNRQIEEQRRYQMNQKNSIRRGLDEQLFQKHNYSGHH